MGDIERVGTEEMLGGEVNSLPPHQVGLSEAISGQNHDPRSLRGVETRKGRGQHGVDNGSDAAVDGIKSWTRDAGTHYLITRVGTTFYDASAAAWASIGIGGTDGEIFQAEALNNVLAIAVDGLAPQKYDASTMGALGGSPPSAAKYATVYVSKLWLAGDSSNPQTKSFSATNNPEDWTGVNDAGSITSQDGGGDNIRGLAANKRVLLTFYRNFTDVLSGESVFNFREERLMERGLVSETGYASAGEVVFWASEDAIYMVAGTNVSDITTLKFRETYQAISDKSQITLAIKQDLLLVVDYGNDTAYACAYKYPRWATWTGQEWKCMDTGNFGTLFAGVDGASTTQIWELDSGTLDGADSITVNWRTPNIGYGWPDAIKNLNKLKVHVKPGMGTMTVTYYANGSAVGSTNTIDAASFASHAGDDHAWGLRHGQRGVRGEYIGFQFAWTGQYTMYGWWSYAEVTSDRGSIPVE